MELCRCSKSMAYKIIASTNKELKEKGYMVFRGRVNRQYLEERLGVKKED